MSKQNSSGIQGYHVWWDYEHDGLCSRAELEALAKKYELTDYLPAPPARGRTMRRAMADADAGLRAKDFHHSLVAHDSDVIVYRVWQLEREERDAEMRKEVLVQYNKEHEFYMLTPATSEAAVTVDSVLAPCFAAVANKVGTKDISAVVTRAMMDLHRIPLKRSGHIYYVDISKEKSLLNIEAFMKEAGHKFYVAVAHTREEYINEGVDRTIDIMLNDVTKRVGNLTRERSFTRAFSDLEALEEMTALYGTVLSGAKRVLDKKIAEAKTAVTERLSEVTKAKDAESTE